MEIHVMKILNGVAKVKIDARKIAMGFG